MELLLQLNMETSVKLHNMSKESSVFSYSTRVIFPYRYRVEDNYVSTHVELSNDKTQICEPH